MPNKQKIILTNNNTMVIIPLSPEFFLLSAATLISLYALFFHILFPNHP